MLDTSSDQVVVISESGVSSPTSKLRDIAPVVDEAYRRYGVLRFMEEIARVTGGCVTFRERYSYLPALIGDDQKPVFLYHLVELLDEFVDLGRIRAEFPSLSYSQIASGIAFLRKMAQ